MRRRWFGPAVGTPPAEAGSADLRYGASTVARTFGRNIKKYTILVTKCTVPVGTAVKGEGWLSGEDLDRRGEQVDFEVASNPEFLKEGAAIKDFMSPDRVVVGVESERAKNVMAKLYRPFLTNNFRVYFMDIPSAEMTKYAANAMLATRISFMNDIANLCDKVGADVNMVRKGIGTDSRIGNKFLYAGCGYGGSCFPKDVKALAHTGREYGMGKCLYIFRETGTSVTASGIQEFIADTAIRPDSFAHHIYISSHFIAQIGNIVHKRDTRGKHRIGRIFRHLGRWNIHKINTEIIRQERPIKFSHYIFGPFTFYAHHHPVRRHKIFNSCAFFQKFRIRCHLKIHLLPAAIQFFPDNRLHLDCSPYGNRGFSNQNRIFLDVTSKSTGHVRAHT